MSNLFLKKAAILALLISTGSVEAVRLEERALGKVDQGLTEVQSMIA